MSEHRTRWVLALASIGAFLLIMTLEIATENDGLSVADIAVDALTLLLTIASVASAVLLFGRIEDQGRETRLVIAELEAARRDGAGWRAAVGHHVEGLKAAIEAQFDAWAMTPAERDIALLVLKGFSHKEIAAMRATSERTIRQQAQSVYRKSGLAGKNGLSAFFLEDLLSPKSVRDREPANAGTPGAGNGATNGHGQGAKRVAPSAVRPGVG